MCMDARRNSGVTLVEMLVTIAALAVLASFALPSLTTVMQNNALTSGVNSLLTALTLSRAEALKREQPVTICRTDVPNAPTPACGAGAGWETGWVVFVDDDGDAALDGDEEVVLRDGGIANADVRVLVASDADPLDESLTYLPTGFPDLGTNVDGGRNMVFCDSRNDDTFARVINLSQTGRTQVRMLTDMGNIGLSCE